MAATHTPKGADHNGVKTVDSVAEAQRVTMVDGAGAAASPLSSNVEKTEDAAHASGDKGVMLLAVRKDTAAALAGTDGDYIPIIVDANGRLHVVQPTNTVGGAASLPAGTNNIGDVDVLTLKGAASIANGQATAGSASGELVATRATRRSVTVRNTDASNSCYVGTGTVSAATGFLLKAGESVAINTTAAINGIRATADVTVCYLEEYD